MGILDLWASCVSLQVQDLAQDEARARVVSTRAGQDAAAPIFLTSTGVVGRGLHPPGCTRHKDAGVTCAPLPVCPSPPFLQKSWLPARKVKTHFKTFFKMVQWFTPVIGWHSSPFSGELALN